LRPSEDRGRADFGWLRSQHSFSFGEYHDPLHMGFGNLRVINEDRIAPGTGFGTHGHRDMEIVSVVLAGALAHRDSLGNGTSIHPTEVQRMTAGTGVRHSEFNHAQGQDTHFLQIWLLPHTLGLEPGYEQRTFDPTDQQGRLVCVARPGGGADALNLNADASIYLGRFDGAAVAALALAPDRCAWVQVIRGRVQVNGQVLGAGDGAGLRGESRLTLSQGESAEVLVFDLAA
jgi:redox-sensitive bicupin YhaK (pirin superfamily)